jgi:hypothetical protein
LFSERGAGRGLPRLAPKFRVAGVTFDFWETLFMDTPELDRRRDELRCQGLQENLAKLWVGRNSRRIGY